MAYNIYLISPAEREARIKRAIDSSKDHADFYHFRSSKTKLPVIRISIDVPVYRMENFRTFTDQKEFVSIENVEPNFFKLGQEKESIQQVQHNILAKLAKKGKDNTITPVIEVLRKSKQQEPLLITINGIIVNGNRRLAAMRELFSEKTLESESFRDIEVMVLPADVTSDEIKDIEASLQGKPETKLDYDWIGDAQLIASQVSIHRSYHDVSQRLNRSEKDIRNTLNALSEADLYLKEWAKSEGQYSKVTDDAEQFFKDLPKALEGKDARLTNASRAIAWTLFENKEKLPTRFYDYTSAFGKLAEDVLDRFSTRIGISTEKKIDDDDFDSGDFAIEVEDDSSSSNYEEVIDILKDSGDDDAIDILIETTIDVIETAKGQKSGDAALKAASQANSKLMSIDLSKASVDTHGKIKKQLESIENVVRKLKESLEKYRG